MLNIPSRSHEDLVLRIGSCSGYNGDKYDLLDIEKMYQMGEPGLLAVDGPVNVEKEEVARKSQLEFEYPLKNQTKEIIELLCEPPTEVLAKQKTNHKKFKQKLKVEQKEYCGVKGMVAHLHCRVTQVIDHPGHALLVCTITSASADSRFWNGKQLIGLDALLSFLGTKRFGYVQS